MRSLRILLQVCLIFLSGFVSAQIAIIDYMYVEPSAENTYLELEETWKKVHQERVKVGLIDGWYLYRIRYAGTSSPYQYATISYYHSFDDSENLFFEGVFETALPGMDLDSLFDHTESVRNMIKSEVFVRAEGLEYDFHNPAKFIYMNFIHVIEGQEDTYEEVERYIWKPIHQQLREERKMADWSLWNLWFYTHDNYNYITMNEFFEYRDIDSYNYSETFEKVHQGRDITELIQETGRSRTSYKTELWELVDYVTGDN